MRRLTRSAPFALAAAILWAAILAPSAPAAGPNRAAIVVDTGTQVKTACVDFTSQSISGIEALRRAGFAPSVRSFGGLGGAVCMMCGKGCPADRSCLTCDSPNHWAYHRAPGGSGSFATSGAGAGATKVRNGDVEGWRFGSGAAPPFRSFESICPTAKAAPPPAHQPRGHSSGGGETNPGPGGVASAGAGAGGAGQQQSGDGSTGAGSASAADGPGTQDSSGAEDAAASADTAGDSDPDASGADGAGGRESGDSSSSADVDTVAASDRVSEGAGLWSLAGFAIFAVVLAAAVVAFRVHKRRARNAGGA